MFLSNSKLLIEFTDDIGMGVQIFVSFSLCLVVLKALSKEKNTLKCKDLFACISEIVAAHSHFALKFRSVFSMEWSLLVKKLEKNDTY